MTKKRKQGKNPKISIITTVKGRWKYLKQSIPTVLNQSFRDFEYIIVDYSCPQHSGDKTKRLFKDKRIKIVKVPVKKNEWNFSRSRNQGFLKAKGEYVLFIDSDAILGRDFLRQCLRKIRKNSFISGWKHGWDPKRIGPQGYVHVLFTKKGYFKKSLGYNEELGENWGYEDIDMFVRLKNEYKMLFSPNIIRAIPNTKKERCRYNKIKTKNYMYELGPRNMIIASERFRGFDGKIVYYKDTNYEYSFPKKVKDWLYKWRKKQEKHLPLLIQNIYIF